MNEDWRYDAACKDTDPESFYPEKGGSTWAARRLCNRCPVTAECLAYALEHRETQGIWGGTSPRQRRPLLPPPPLPGDRDGCASGHSWRNPNNYRITSDGYARCKACQREKTRRRAA